MLERTVNWIPWKLRQQIKHIPGVKGLQQFIVNKWLDGRSFNHRINSGPASGLTFPITMPQDKLYWTGTWEADITEALRDATNDSDVCYDIGCHKGFMAGVMGLAGASTVHCFEANPANCKQIETVIALNPELPLKLHEMAVTKEDGTLSFSIHPDSAMGKISDVSFQSDLDDLSQIEVPGRCIDSMITAGDLDPPDLLKIDVEGAEMDVIKGAAATIDEHHPRFLIELHTLELARSCIEFLHERGYHCSVIEPDVKLTESGFRVCHLLASAE